MVLVALMVLVMVLVMQVSGMPVTMIAVGTAAATKRMAQMTSSSPTSCMGVACTRLQASIRLLLRKFLNKGMQEQQQQQAKASSSRRSITKEKGHREWHQAAVTARSRHISKMRSRSRI